MNPNPSSYNPNQRPNTGPTQTNPTATGGGAPSEVDFGAFLRISSELGIYSPIQLLPGFKKIIAIPFQKILIVRTDSIDSQDLLKENNETTLLFTPTGSTDTVTLSVRVVRVCEYPNPPDEYVVNGQPVPTNTVLVEWQGSQEAQANAPFGRFSEGQKGLVDSQIIGSSQIENLIIQDPPNNQPGPPIVKADEDIPLPDGFSVENSDFNINPPQGTPASATDSIVAVLDTGIKTRFKYDNGSVTHQYPDSSQPSQMRSFKLASAPAAIQHQNGYCSVTNYLRASSDTNQADKAYKGISTLQALKNLSKKQILASPYDDHLLTNGQEERGRHGTTISAIINQKSRAAVLPVKIFNHGGQGTLYDLLCGLNYVLACKGNGLPIQVVNFSLAGQLHYDAYLLLRAKFKALRNAGIWAVAAAGNRQITANENSRRELKANVTNPVFDPSANLNQQEVWNLFPACFAGDADLSVITVTTVRELPSLIPPPKPKPTNPIWALIQTLIQAIFGQSKPPVNPVNAPVYKAVNNYGRSFVSVGVIEPLTKVFKNANDGLNTTSFAVAFFSAKLADYLHSHPTANRQQVFNDLTFGGNLEVGSDITDNRLVRFQ